MNSGLETQLQAIFGDRATCDLFERQCYQRDLAPVPEFLVRPIAKTLPDMVVRPAYAEQVSQLVKAASVDRIPITTRSGGSTVYFNSVCSQGGILVDMNGLDGVQAIDRSRNLVRVSAGATWTGLERTINRHGLTACSYPSSAPTATVGGWLAMQGYGLGSLKYGSLLAQVKAAEAVLPDGTRQELSADSAIPVSWLAGSEGTLGIITAVELQVRPQPDREWHGLAACADPGKLQSFIEAAVRLPSKPFNLHFSDPACNAVKNRLGLASERAASAYTVAFDVDGTAAETTAAELGFRQCLQLVDAADWSEEADAEWEHRFYSLVLKREGPSLLGVELWLPNDQIAAYLQSVATYEGKMQLGLKSYGHIVTSERAMVMTMFNADERDTMGYLQGLALVKKLHDIGARHGAMPYGIGLWNTPYLDRCYSRDQLRDLRLRKKMLDPQGIMNPGKLYQAPLLLQQPLFGLGMDLLAATRLVYNRRGRS